MLQRILSFLNKHISPSNRIEGLIYNELKETNCQEDTTPIGNVDLMHIDRRKNTTVQEKCCMKGKCNNILSYLPIIGLSNSVMGVGGGPPHLLDLSDP